MNRLAILFLILTGIIQLISCDQSSAPSPQSPNIILFLIDDFGYGDISFEGNTQIQTPNIDRIAKGGAHFTRFYQSSGACAPTRASLLTGRYHLETGVWGVHGGRDFIHRDETTIADALKQAGYKTGAFGKWHSGKTWRYFAWNRGFDVGVHTKLYRYFDLPVLYNNKLVHVDGPVTDVVGDQAARFIRENKDTPFFCYVPFQAIHEPFNSPDSVFQRYKSQGYSDHVAHAYGMIEVLDQNVGKILNTVEQLGLEDNTVIMFLSDDGPSPGRMLSYAVRRMNPTERTERERAWKTTWRGGKATIWEGGSITPFYIQWKNHIQPGSSFNQLAGIIDIFPTIMDICGVKHANENLPLAGKSIRPVLEGKAVEDWDERMYFDNGNFYQIPREAIDFDRPAIRNLSVHHQNYKLVRVDPFHFESGPVQYHLFDLEKDPKEETNLYDQQPELASKLSRAIDDWYGNILNSGRAFKQAIYEVGNPEEIASPINFDGLSGLSGTVERTNASGFAFHNWTPGSKLQFDIDVVESGSYQVELRFNVEDADLGALFRVYGPADTADVRIEQSAYAVSETLNLSEGEQPLTVELVEMGNGTKAVNAIRSLIVHRLPTKDQSTVINPGFELSTSGDHKETVHYSSATADFMTGRRISQEPLKVASGETIQIRPFAENEKTIQQVELFMGFESVEIKQEAPFAFSFTAPADGSKTINVEFTDKSGRKFSVYRTLQSD